MGEIQYTFLLRTAPLASRNCSRRKATSLSVVASGMDVISCEEVGFVVALTLLDTKFEPSLLRRSRSIERLPFLSTV